MMDKEYSDDESEEYARFIKELRDVDQLRPQPQTIRHPQVRENKMFSEGMEVVSKASQTTLKQFINFEERSKCSQKQLRTIKLSNIPPGFAENDIEGYFQQFGKVLRTVLVKSEKTGKSRHFAFIEFKNPEVAEIAAETMNNYVVFKRVMKACLVESPKINIWASKLLSPDNCPGYYSRMENVARVNRRRSIMKAMKMRKRRISKLKRKINKLMDMGIDYNYMPRVVVTEEQQDARRHELEKRNNKNRNKKRKQFLEEQKSRELKKKLPKRLGKLRSRAHLQRIETVEAIDITKCLEEERQRKPDMEATDISKYKEYNEDDEEVIYSSFISKLNEPKMVMEIDESDTEIEFKTPPNVVKRKIVKGSYPKFSL